MSYLVDALKKAEQERRAQSEADLQAAAHGPATQRTGLGHRWAWLLAILVATNVALVLYIWRPQPAASADDTAGRTPALSEAAGRVAAAPHVPPPEAGRDASPERNHTAASAAGSSAGDSVAASAPPANILQDTPGSRALQDRNPGRVTYARRPLTGPGEPDSPTFSSSGADQPAAANPNLPTDESADAGSDTLSAADPSAPAITINGQLYSTVPGRSFILVNGRRYHEGERLAAGPAVEQIEPSGAILRYQGQRYHVPGPG